MPPAKTAKPAAKAKPAVKAKPAAKAKPVAAKPVAAKPAKAKPAKKVVEDDTEEDLGPSIEFESDALQAALDAAIAKNGGEALTVKELEAVFLKFLKTCKDDTGKLISTAVAKDLASLLLDIALDAEIDDDEEEEDEGVWRCRMRIKYIVARSIRSSLLYRTFLLNSHCKSRSTEVEGCCKAEGKEGCGETEGEGCQAHSCRHCRSQG
jgi:hypothetical protein